MISHLTDAHGRLILSKLGRTSRRRRGDLGEVVVFKPRCETLVFKDAAEAKAATLFERMVSAARRLILAQTTNSLEVDHAALVDAQREYQKAVAQVEFIAETFEAADKQRSDLWRLPEGQQQVLVANSTTLRQSAVLCAERHRLQVTCSDFEMYEETESGTVNVFKALAK